MLTEVIKRHALLTLNGLEKSRNRPRRRKGEIPEVYFVNGAKKSYSSFRMHNSVDKYQSC
jgi:hypothetical protein